MSLYFLIVSIACSNLIFLILRLIHLSGVFTRRKFSEKKPVHRFVHQDVEIKDDEMKPGIDLISALPCSIIHEILGFLHLPDIVKMSMLSREWKSNYLTCPELTFNFRFNSMLLRDRKLEPLILHILSRHQGPLIKFSVQVPELKSGHEIDEWIRLLPGNTLQDLTLEISIGEKHKMASHLFTFKNLRKLRLSNCVFNTPAGFEGFPKLVNLHFQSVGLVPGNFTKFLQSCPAVESLRMFHCTKFDCLEITGPKLKFLEFVGCFQSVSFVNCHVLSDVRLTLSSINFDESKCFSFDLVRSLDYLPMLEELSLQAYALETLVDYGAPNKLPILLRRLKNLNLMDMYFENPAEGSCAICFIKSCPNLTNLRISSFTSKAVDTVSVAEFLRKQETVPKSPSSLKSVKMYGFCGIESEMEFVKFLLASASALEEMAIRPHEAVVFDGGESIVMELKQYTRASPRVKIGALVRKM